MAHGQLYYNQIRSGGVNVQNASYNVQEADAFKLVVMYSTASPPVILTATLPASPPSTLWRCKFGCPANAPTDLIVSPNGKLLDTAAGSLTLLPGQGVEVYTDGTNYFTERGIGTGAAGANFADNETPSGTINGSNTAFTLAHSPSPTGSLILVVSGAVQLAGTDFTLSGASITMTTAPAASVDWLRAWYRY